MNDSRPSDGEAVPALERATGEAVFATTRWSVVVTAGGNDTSESRVALEALCRAYWMPLYAFARCRGNTQKDAEDLTQSFFAHFLSKRSYASAHREKGRFRSFLLGAFKHFMADDHDRFRAQKRGGGIVPNSLDADDGESCYRWEPMDDRSPDTLFDRRWALTLMMRALERLEEESRMAGKTELFGHLRAFLSEGAEAHAYRETARRLDITEANLRMKVSRLRRRYGELVRSEVAETVADVSDVKDEMRHLLEILRDRTS